MLAVIYPLVYCFHMQMSVRIIPNYKSASATCRKMMCLLSSAHSYSRTPLWVSCVTITSSAPAAPPAAAQQA